jgi:hypothetical protein
VGRLLLHSFNLNTPTTTKKAEEYKENTTICLLGKTPTEEKEI